MSSECKYDSYWYISACSGEYEVCDSFASPTRQQTSYSWSVGWYFRNQSIHIQITYTYTYIVGNYIIYLFCPLETSIKLHLLLAFLSCFTAVVTAFCIFSQCTHNVFILQCHPPPQKKPKQNNKQLLNCRKRTKTSDYSATVSYRSSTWIRYQKKLYHEQWPYSMKHFPGNAIWLNRASAG